LEGEWDKSRALRPAEINHQNDFEMTEGEVQPQPRSIELIGAPAARDLPFSSSFVVLFLGRALALWLLAREWMRRSRYRRELRSMGQREITDFCPKVTDALHEAEKPFWRP
jgi:uncharacterized protein YjiS (DUF1127 family)